MNKIFLTSIFCFLGCLTTYAQFTNGNTMGNRRNRSNLSNGMVGTDLDPDSLLGQNKVNANTVPHDIRAWKIDPLFGETLPAEVDTLHLNFQNTNNSDGMNGEYNMLGNMGSPRLSRIFLNRKSTTQSFFLDPLDFFHKTPENATFYNTKSPFTNLTYHWTGDKTVGDDRFRALFTVNGNRRLNMGFLFDYLYGRGYYQYQANSYTSATLFSNYQGDKYQMHFLFGTNHMKQQENGGIENDDFIKRPEDLSQNISSNTIPTVLTSTWNRNDGISAYLSHRYNLGFYRAVEDSTLNDSVPHRTFVPVTSIIHTFRMETNHHRFISRDNIQDYFADLYYQDDEDFDRTRYMSVQNTFGLQLKEGFNKYAQAGLTGFLKHEYRSFELPDLYDDGSLYRHKYTDNIVSVGGELRRALGKHLNYDVVAEAKLSGEESGDLDVHGNIHLDFRLLGDTIHLQAGGYIKNQTPAFLLRHYHAHHFWWDNDLDKEMRTRIEGTLSLQRTGTAVRIGAEHIRNYTYLNNLAQARYDTEGNVSIWSQRAAPAQHDENLTVFTAQLFQKLHWGVLHWDNEITYQTTSNGDVLPLPHLNIYSNLYLKFNIVKNVMRMQLGADVRYFSKYNAPDYLPALGQYYLQNPDNQVELGNYPIINSYINAEWKRTRIYIMLYSHLNEGKGSRNYFLAPHYPINPMIMKFGISWNFYD